MQDLLDAKGYQNLVKVIEISGIYDPTAAFIVPLRSISLLLMQALFLPALSMTITIGFIKGFSKFISQKLG